MGSLSIALFLALVGVSSCAERNTPTTHLTEIPGASMAAYHTDQYVWEKMARAFTIETDTPTNMEWELWSTVEAAYPDPCGPPATWPKVAKVAQSMPPKLVAIVDDLNDNAEVTQFASLTLNDNPYYEELRINRPMFDYIQENHLYNQNEVYRMAKEGTINFPAASMMIKAQWIPVNPDSTGGYYTKRMNILIKDLQSGDSAYVDTLCGLVGFHLVTHELPNWVWSTFEYKGNVGLCDYIGCKDQFGCTESYIPPHEKVNQGYKIGQTTAQLQSLFDEFNVPAEFQNYRLKGSQTEYTDNNGDTLVLGNSILEMNLVETSSCISCHARATLNNGSPRANLGMFLDSSFTGSFRRNTDTTTLGWHPKCYMGTPVPADYVNLQNGVNVPDSTYYRTNFLWQLAQHVEPCRE